MTGAILEHVERVRAGKPLYAAPSEQWVPFLYPPLFYVLAAKATALFGGTSDPVLFATRSVSLAATGVAAASIAFLARGLRASPFWIAGAVFLFFGAYSYVEYWYDLERCDTLAVALLLAASAVYVHGPSAVTAALSGALMGAAVFAKQPAWAFVGAGAVGLGAARRGRDALAFAAAALLVEVPTAAWLDATTGGFYRFYCVTVPSSHGMALKLFTVFFVRDVAKAWLLLAATTLVAWQGLPLVQRAWRTKDALAGDDLRFVFFASQLGAAFAASASSRLHIGGWPNVLMFWSSFACPAVAVVATRLDAKGVVAASLTTSAALLLQLGLFAFDPTDVIPEAPHQRAAARVRAVVARLEEHGEVFSLVRGHLTRTHHPHAAALNDVLRMPSSKGGGVPPSILEAFTTQRFAGVVLNDMYDLDLRNIIGRRSELHDVVLARYFVAVRLGDERTAKAVIGFPARPTWVLRPRKHPLPDASAEELDRRAAIEQGLAEARMRRVEATLPPGTRDGAETAPEALGAREGAEQDLGDGIEEEAAEQVARAPSFP